MNLSQEVSQEPTITELKKPRRSLSFLYILLLTLGLTLFIELLNHKAFVSGPDSFLRFVTHNPIGLLVNASLVLVTLAPSLFVRRRVFWCTLVSLIWLVGGSVNGFILLNRMTPFTVQDLSIFQTGLDTIPNYLSTKWIVLMVITIILAIAGLILLFWKGPKCPLDFRHRGRSGVLALLFSVGILVGGWHYSFQQGYLSERFPNLAFAYEDYGFSYCFLQTWLNRGIKRPEVYNADVMEALRQPEIPSTPQSDVNVLYVQLESFIDPWDVKGLELSQDALPFWHELTENFSTGYLNVPVVGAGTANSECEMLTGMSTRMFGPGEYPYQTALMDQTVESVAYNLKELGYGTHAIHNHRAAFYHRNQVYANLGFDDFTALEYMPKAKKTPKNWAKDAILTSQILQAMDTTPNQPDLVFTVSVQGHGKYPTEPILEDPAITVTDCPLEEYRYGLEYFVNQIYEMDQFVRDLVTALEERGEKTVLVLYGDHLPALHLRPEDMKSGTLYNTTYVIWDNIGLPKEDMDLAAYQLSSVLMERLGVTNGNMNRYHQLNREEPDYLNGLHALQYDALYGPKYLTDGVSPYAPTDMQMGSIPIVMDAVFQVSGEWYLFGQNFTPFCKVFVDGHQVKTSYKSPKMLRLKDDPGTRDLSKYTIKVMDKHKEVLSEVPGPQ